MVLELYPKEIQEFVYKYCPFKIGDKVIYTSLYASSFDSLKLVCKGAIVDICPHLMRETIPHFEQSPLYKVEINEKETERPMGKFTLWVECDIPDEKPWYKAFAKNTYHKETKCVTVDMNGFVIEETSFAAFKEITKI